jgi:hypothetical protein
MTDEAESNGATRDDGEGGALLSRLKVIEDQPLETRAEHLGQVYEELRATLESGDSRAGESRPSI